LESVVFEKFAVYKFSIDYPTVCRIEFNPKTRREAGDIVFHFPDREKVFLSWGDLQKALKKFPTAQEQAEHSIGSVKKSGNVRNLQKISQDSLTINTHRAALNRVKLEEIGPGFFSRRTVPHEAYSVHLHCNESSRYFAIYTMLSAQAPEDFEELFMSMVNSFRCHLRP